MERNKSVKKEISFAVIIKRPCYNPVLYYFLRDNEYYGNFKQFKQM